MRSILFRVLRSLCVFLLGGIAHHAAAFHVLPWLAMRADEDSRYVTVSHPSYSIQPVIERRQVNLPRRLMPYVYWGMLYEYLPPGSVLERVELHTADGRKPVLYVWTRDKAGAYEFVIDGVHHVHEFAPRLEPLALNQPMF